MNTTAEGSGVLHLLLSANAAALDDCLACCFEEDCVALLGEAVMLMSGDESPLRFPCRIAVSAADAAARGVGRELAAAGVELVDDAALMGLIESHRHCLSWR